MIGCHGESVWGKVHQKKCRVSSLPDPVACGNAGARCGDRLRDALSLLPDQMCLCTVIIIVSGGIVVAPQLYQRDQAKKQQ